MARPGPCGLVVRDAPRRLEASRTPQRKRRAGPVHAERRAAHTVAARPPRDYMRARGRRPSHSSAPDQAHCTGGVVAIRDTPLARRSPTTTSPVLPDGRRSLRARNKMSNRATHWCYACRRPIRLRGQDIICPNCNDGFIQEISEMGGMLNTYGFIEPDFEERRARRFGMMDAMSSLMRQRMAEMGRDSLFDIPGRQGTGAEYGRRPTAVPTLIFGGNPSAGVDSSDVNVVFRGPRRVGPVRPNFSGLLVGPSLEALFEQLLLQNSREGPAAAPQSAIDSMPVVKINHRHLDDDPQCAICKDKFEVGAEAREMPCKHLYHTDCIIPWLVQHNSCPVCRHPLPSQRSDSTSSARRPSAYYNEATDPPGVTRADLEPAPINNGSESQERQSSFSFLWPFGQSSSNSSSYQYEENADEPAVYDPNQIAYSEWHYDH